MITAGLVSRFHAVMCHVPFIHGVVEMAVM